MAYRELDGMNLRLFDGEAGSGTEGQGLTGDQGDAKESPAEERDGKSGRSGKRSGRKSGEFSKVIFGKQASEGAAASAGGAEQEAPDAGEEGETSGETPEQRREAFRKLVQGDYKDLYDEDVQKIISRRFKAQKGLEKRVADTQGLLDILGQRYGIQDGDVEKLTRAVESDTAWVQEAADRAGLTPEQYRQTERMKRELAESRRALEQYKGQEAAKQQLAAWMSQAEEVQQEYPDFDLVAEQENKDFLALLRAGIPMKHAYEVTHMEEIKSGIAKRSAGDAEKRMAENIRAKGQRPQENGLSAQGGFTVRDDVRRLTRAERAEIAKRVQRGESITF